MSRQKTAERKFQAQRRLVQGGAKIKPYSTNKNTPSRNPALQTSSFFPAAKNMLKTVKAYVWPDKSEIKSKPQSLLSNPSSLLITALLAFLPPSRAQVIPPIGETEFFSIGDCNYAIVPWGDISWINGSCGVIMTPTGTVDGPEILAVCTAGKLIVTNGWSRIYAGLNTTANMTAALECLEQLGQKRCDENNKETLVVALFLVGGVVLCLAGCGVYFCLKRYRTPAAEEDVQLGAVGYQGQGFFQGAYHQLGELTPQASRAESPPSVASDQHDFSDEEGTEAAEKARDAIQARLAG